MKGQSYEKTWYHSNGMNYIKSSKHLRYVLSLLTVLLNNQIKYIDQLNRSFVTVNTHKKKKIRNWKLNFIFPKFWVWNIFQSWWHDDTATIKFYWI
jgi:hypothetical protein